MGKNNRKKILRKELKFRTTQMMINALDDLAKIKGSSRSQMIREAINNYVRQEYRNELKSRREHQETLDNIRDHMLGW